MFRPVLASAVRQMAPRRWASTSAPAAAASAAVTRAAQGPAAYLSVNALQGLEKRWSRLPECEKGAIHDALHAKEKGDWKALSMDEKRALYFIAYGAYGPRQTLDPSVNKKVACWVGTVLTLTFGIWMYWQTTLPKLRTTTPEWIAAQTQRAVENKVNPYTGEYASFRQTPEGQAAERDARRKLGLSE